MLEITGGLYRDCDGVSRRRFLRAGVLGGQEHGPLGGIIDQIGGVLTRPRVKAWLERVTGGLLVALGLRLAWERR